MDIFKRYNKSAAVIILIISIVAIYGQVIRFDFVNFDDSSYVYDNEIVKSGLNRGSICWAFSFSEGDELKGWLHPLTWLSHMLDCELFGLNPGMHHLTNVFLHIISSLLLLSAFYYMTGYFWRSLALVCIFSLHPLRVESIAWVTGRKDILCAIFGFLTLIVYTKYSRSGNIFFYILSIVTFALGLLSKSTLVTLPFVLLLLDYWPLGRFEFLKLSHTEADLSKSKVLYSCRRRRTLFLLLEKVPFFVLSVLDSVLGYFVQRSSGAVAPVGSLSLPFVYRFSNVLISYAKYIGQFILPVRLEFFYPHPEKNIIVSNLVISITVLILISAVLLFFHRRRYTTMGWLWYLGTLVPVIGFVRIGSHARADRFTYIPGIGLAVIIVWSVSSLMNKIHSRRLVIPLYLFFFAAFFAFGFLSWRQTGTWENDMALFGYAAKIDKGNWYANLMLGRTYKAQKQYDKALEYYQEAQRIRPTADFQDDIGQVLIMQEKYEEAISLYQGFLPKISDPNWSFNFNAGEFGEDYDAVILCSKSFLNCGFAFMKTGRMDEAVRYFHEALRYRPDYIIAHQNLISIFLSEQKYDEAIEQSVKLLEIAPDLPRAHYELGLALLNKGEYARAILSFEKAKDLNPDEVMVYYHLGEALRFNGQIERAIEEYFRIFKLYPDWLGLKNKIAFLLAAYKETKYYNPTEAIRIAQQVCERTDYKEPEPLDTLSIAYASEGDFTLAVEYAKKALELAIRSGDESLAQNIKKRLKLYESGQAFYFSSTDPND